MSKIAVDRFLSLVERSGLVDGERLTSAVAEWKRKANPAQLDDAAHCGQHLVDSALLTDWQCHKLLEGRHRGFMLGNYKLLDHLGSGGMSNVYLAEHVIMQRLVAIKVLPEHRVTDASYLARFQFEGQAVAALDHPNIVRAYDLGCEGRIHYLVMEFVDGYDLEALVDRLGPLDCHAVADYGAQAAAGLVHAHGCGLVHRDIKPANLLVDRHGVVKILDMGLAKFASEVRPQPEFAQDEQILGTAEYFAPEQTVNSQTVDGRADIYGLGCTLYFLLTGHPPFRGRSPLELMTAHRQQAAPRATDERPEVPAALAEICRRMMEKSPSQRFQTAQEVFDALNAWLADERTAGRYDETSERFGPDASSAALRDTAPDLRDTTRLPRRPEASSDVISPRPPFTPRRATGSDVLPVPPPPPTPPPDLSPPRPSAHRSIPTVAPLAKAAHASISQRPPTISSDTLPDPREHFVRSGRKRGSAAHWWWSIVLSALVLGAILLALFAFAR